MLFFMTAQKLKTPLLATSTEPRNRVFDLVTISGDAIKPEMKMFKTGAAPNFKSFMVEVPALAALELAKFGIAGC